MRIVVDKFMADSWKWSSDLTIFVRPRDLKNGEHYVWTYVMHELMEASVAKATCGGRCADLCERLLDDKWSLQRNPFKINTRGRAGVCHVLTWLIGRW